MANYYKSKQLELKNSIYAYQVLENKQQIKLTLKPGVTEKVRISYSVKYPKHQTKENL